MTEEWKNSIEPDLREKLGDIKDLNAMAKTYIESQSLIGKMSKRVELPTADAPEEQWAEFYNKVRDVKAPEEYGVKRPEQVSSLADDDYNSIVQAAYEAGLSKKQVEKVVGKLNDLVITKESGFKTQREELDNQRQELLKDKFGEKLSEVQANAEEFLKITAGAEVAEHYKSLGLLNDPSILHGIYRQYKASSSDKGLTEAARSGVQGISPEAAKKEMQELILGIHPKYKNSLTGYGAEKAEAQQRLSFLQNIIYGE